MTFFGAAIGFVLIYALAPSRIPLESWSSADNGAMHLPEPTQEWFRGTIDRRLGTSKLAIHLRVVGSVALFYAIGVLHDRRDWAGYLLWGVVSVELLVLFPRLRDLGRVYGERFVARAIYLLVLGVPLFFAVLFTTFVLTGDAHTFVSAEALWGMRVVLGLLALAGWWAVFKVLGIRREFFRAVREFGR